MMMLVLQLALGASEPPLPADTKLQVLPAGDLRSQLQAAGEKLGSWEIELAGVPVDGEVVTRLANPPEGEDLTRWVREQTGRAVDLKDLVYFLDDVLRAEDRRGERFIVHSGRARNAGILLHPDDVFRDRPRNYPGKRGSVAVDPPKRQEDIETPAEDGSPPSPEWTVRYQNPSDRDEMLAAIDAERPESDFRVRLTSLLEQIEAEGGEVYLASTTRSRERGYLMWGAFTLSRAKDENQLNARIAMLEDRNKTWGLDVPIQWRHPDGWEATRDAARRMAETYDVVYATEKGAKSSNHYGAIAADVVGLDLPRRLTLTAPDGACRSFDLSDPAESRDLSLTPRLIDWIEAHWGLKKLLTDYPHWSDTKR